MVNILILKKILENHIAFSSRKYSTLIIPKEKKKRNGNENGEWEWRMVNGSKLSLPFIVGKC